MISLSHTTGYAILALSCIGSWKGDWVQTEQIHNCTGVPKPYLRKILHAMRIAGLINTKRGYQGGFVLARPPKEITLLDVVEAVETNDPGSSCLLGMAGCSDANPCPLRRFWGQEWAKIEAELTRKTLLEMAKFVKGSQGTFATCPDPDYVPKCGQAKEAKAKKTAKVAKRKATRPTNRKRP